jgi:hypothetical protein
VNPATETEGRPETARREDRRLEILANLGLLQLAACLGTALAVVIAINLLD